MRIAAVIVALCAFCVAVTYAANGPGGASSGQTIGMVNVDKVMSEYTKAKDANEQLQTMGKKLEGQLKMMAAHRLLNEQEMNEYVTLQLKDKPTAADKTRITALADLDKQREDKLRNLQNMKQPTQAQKQELTDLQGYVTKSGKVIQEAEKKYQKQLTDENKKLLVEITDEMKVAIEQVAKDTNTDMVLNKAAVIVGGTDLTDQVVKKLNKT